MKTNNFSNIKIEAITGEQTLPIRHAVLRKGKPIEACPIPEDNLKTTYHFGLFYNNKLVAVSTFVIDKSVYFKEPNQYRLRAMGVLEGYQGLQLGKQLLNFGVHFLKEKKVERLWFNARIIALNFYKKNGFETIGPVFNIPNVGDHFVMHKKL
ncbi:GNAT family N-acetyltransferase [Lacinutrix venerupis]|uniref:N-acetyltransferase domain-containing protein n=1 Tax=Lacinutrix venerupis TaxID=1486034 RepID=A0AAC9PXZ1_9FLAO|nr:GNAT family N-acetyltransferase [Lacinutrix venerupis]APY01134.1 hypothetical protein BWR22_12720 [Lacinutrix venerupis]